jgi:endonuclease YncB( thermonuclease family)
MKRFLLVLALSALPACAPAQEMSGPASPVDGDSFELTGTGVRLFGIDAPEGRQTCTRNGTAWACGEAASETLRGLLANGPVRCRVRERDVYGRAVATCTASGVDLGDAMVRSGLAIALPNGADLYGEAEAVARNARAGVWAGTFDRPADWRAANRRDEAPRLARPAAPARTQAAPSSRVWRNNFGCAIKGNISRRQGEAIYYLPGMKYYEETRPEALFCTEAEAQAAGYRRSRGG